MKKLFSTFLLAGVCACGIAGSVTLHGTGGATSTYIVVPEEHAGKEGQFVATASSSNTTQVDVAEAVISGDVCYCVKTTTSYGTINFTLTYPSGLYYSTNNKTISALEKGSHQVSISQLKTIRAVTYELDKQYWTATLNKVVEEVTYYVKNGSLPPGAMVSGIPQPKGGTIKEETITSGIYLASSYIVVYGEGDDGGGTTDPGTGGGSSSGGDININIETGTDDGVYTLINSLFAYISEMQNILSASDEAIRSELQAYIRELQSAYQMADTNMAVTIQNQINALHSALSTNISNLRTILEAQIAALQGQLEALQSQQTNLLLDFYQLKTDLQLAIQQNAGNISALSKELTDKYEALVASNSNLRADLLTEIVELTGDYKEADANLISDYTSKIAALQTLLQQADAVLADNISALQSAYQLADARLKENLEQQLASLRSQMNDGDQRMLDQITALEREMNNADNALRQDYENKIGNLEKDLSFEASAIRTEMANQQNRYEAALLNAKTSMEAQMTTLQTKLEADDQRILSQVSALETAMQTANAELKTDYQNRITNLERELSTEAAAIRTEMANLQNQYDTALSNTKSILEEQMATLQANLTAADQQALSQISTLETSLNHALELQKRDHENQINNLNQVLSSEAAALRQEMANLNNAYKTEIGYLKENLELQIANLKENTQKTTDSLQKQVDDLSEKFTGQITELKAKYDAQIAALEAKSDAADLELKAAMEAYVKSLQEQIAAGDEATRAALQAQLDNLSGAFDERLEIILKEYEERIWNVKRQIEELEDDTKISLVTERALLEQECKFEVENLNKTYAERIAEIQKKRYDDRDNTDLYERQIETLETELATKIAGINLYYQKQIVEIDRQLREISTKTALELLAELAVLQTKRDIVEAAINSTDYAEKLAALDEGHRDNTAENKAELEAKLSELEKQLAALVAIGELTVDDIIARIKAGDAANAEEHEQLKVALKLYCDSLKDAMGDRIATLEEVVSALQSTIQQRLNTLENRLTYSLMTDEELATLEDAKQAAANALANQIAGLEVVIDQYRAEGRDTTMLQAQLKSLTNEYYTAVNDLENIRYVIELRSTSELALHRRWIMELQELVAALQIMVNKQAETITQQEDQIKRLEDTIVNLEKALENEIKTLKEELIGYMDGNIDDINAEITDIFSQIDTLRDNIVTLATSSNSGYHSSSTGNNQYNYSGTNKETLTDDRDLRTSGDTVLDF